MAATDEQLIEDFHASRKRELLDELVARHLRRTYSLVRQLVCRDAVAEDLTQEVFLRMVRHLPSFQARAGFATWLHQITLNVVRSHWASEKRRSRFEPLGEEPCGHGPSDVTDTNDEIEAGLARLSPPLRSAIVLVYLQQIDVNDAAKIEGCTASTIYWRLHEARKQLRDHLQQANQSR